MDGRQILAEFIAANGTQSQFARDVDCSESHLSLVLKGDRGVSLKLARRISRATGGAVPAETLVLEDEASQ
jgi:DNA-binding transcriptional regulator YdaS (Cro superfamily)